MHIGYDAKRLFLNDTGLGNYSRTLLQSLTRYHPEHQYHLYTPRTRPRLGQAYLRQPNVHVHTPRGFLARRFSGAWRSIGLGGELPGVVDVYHGLSHELPLSITSSGVPSVVTMHDLIHERYPEQYGRINRMLYRNKFRFAAANATRVVAISEQTKRDLIDFYHVPADRIEVIYQSCDPIFYRKHKPDALEGIREKYRLPHRYLLYVGSIIERKNLLNIVEALSQLPIDYQLVVVGSGKQYFKQVQCKVAELELTNRVLFRKVDFTDLPAVYQAARMLVYPSIFEGFGIPIIEALHSGIPVVTSRGGVFPEAGGGGAVYADPHDSSIIAEAIASLWQDTEYRQQLIEAGRAHVRTFAPERIAGQWMTLYTQLTQL